VAQVCAGPDPQVAAVVRHLVGKEEPREKGKGARGLLAWRVPVYMGPAGPVRVGGNVQRNLGLVERDLDPIVPHQLSRYSKNPMAIAEEQIRGFARGPPVKKVAYVPCRRGRRGHQPVDLSVQSIERFGPDQAGDHDPARAGKGADLVDGQHVSQPYRPPSDNIGQLSSHAPAVKSLTGVHTAPDLSTCSRGSTHTAAPAPRGGGGATAAQDGKIWQ
jgi:hypothetical protein